MGVPEPGPTCQVQDSSNEQSLLGCPVSQAKTFSRPHRVWGSSFQAPCFPALSQASDLQLGVRLSPLSPAPALHGHFANKPLALPTLPWSPLPRASEPTRGVTCHMH